MNGEEQQLTKKQRKELRRQERRDEQDRQRKKGKMTKLFTWIGIAVILLLVGWWIISAGGNAEPIATDSDPFVGSADAAVVVTEYSDFQCPACQSVQPVLKQVIETYGDQIKFIFNNFPLTSIHQNADEAAKAGECAFDQGAFWEYHDVLFDSQDAWSSLSSPKDIFLMYAEDISLDVDAFEACYDGSDAKDRVDYDKSEGNAIGINSTPTFIVNNEEMSGGLSFENFKEAIDAALGSVAVSTEVPIEEAGE